MATSDNPHAIRRRSAGAISLLAKLNCPIEQRVFPLGTRSDPPRPMDAAMDQLPQGLAGFVAAPGDIVPVAGRQAAEPTGAGRKLPPTVMAEA
jgi:hypothetical protein